ncbi:MAG TPA: hypothetical protein VF988_00965 [Verrucomicrobiae bacterium]
MIRWACNPRNLGRTLVAVATLVTLTAIFYLEEDWRGKRAWLRCKAELEAKGEVLDWDKYVPPPVPDDQNFFTASTNILIRFRKAQTPEQTAALERLEWLRLGPKGTNTYPVFDSAKVKPPVVANLIMALPSLTNRWPGTNLLVIALDDATAAERIRRALVGVLGRSANGSSGINLSERSLSNLAPAQVVLKTDTLPSAGDLTNLVPANLHSDLGQLRVLPTVDRTVFQVVLTNVHVVAAADYLKWSDQFVPAFDEIREALKRPYAILPGDYSQAYLMPIPNFVTMRWLAQTLAQRAQCYLLLGQPDKALYELTLMHDVCRILQKPVFGQPETLVEAMVNVSLNGLYVSTLADGFKLQAWREPQLIALQQQLAAVDLFTPVVKGFQLEQVAACHTLMTLPADKIAELFRRSEPVSGKMQSHFWTSFMDPINWILRLVPRGWLYQNITVTARLDQSSLDAFNLSAYRISPRVFDHSLDEIQKTLNGWSWFNFWGRYTIPSFTRAAQTMGYNQTQVYEAQIACAAERYRLVHNEYPDTLDALAPQFIEKLPHDLINGQPLRYQRIDDGKFMLYSIGWDEKDDGGKTVLNRDGRVNFDQGDWVWRY